DLADCLEVSQIHEMKFVDIMTMQNWPITALGKGGGVRLNPDTLKRQLGQIVRILQRDNQIVECNDPPCVLRYGCGLKGILDQAMEQFYASLDQYILGDVIQPVQGHFSLQSPINLINL